MISLTEASRILLATQPADFRKGIDGFVALCQQALQQDPRSGVVFVFINRNKTMIRALHYDGTGFWLMTKRLSKGYFSGWPFGQTIVSAMTAKHLSLLLRGQPLQRLSSI
ncbi:IS66 family insertion sequence element accessory protein TnpB [Endozoicomonas sp. SM1973]|uniref:IS66 family insertion sequence element accessory protein TnpB n=1 Tax=Spartinivicinus marinus TaxID=2994442 RepID=A0A853IL91_9GAMM|nr:IS66 family insertion sequence element accessory protein TnpB [Spartinivicinus marinus]MCX4025026.1 IS66 family insertion sequence element accessory protein TnpB [Spartinivicinus marinus]NYZ69835.1 IS66 family insertion sequence element accessory protein TnpB [Spartinivicinus marinus]